MSEQLSFDRKKGFVALPVEIMDFDLTPGAFRTLAELCRMANAEGFCWPSLLQLSERLGRSRSAISGYIKELRAAELVDTEEQKTANGYNYRLKYRVTFWQSWRASLRGRTVQKPERSVQPAARIEDSKKQIHLNHEPKTCSVDFDNILSAWSKCFTGAPYPLARQTPSAGLLALTEHALNEANPADCAGPDHVRSRLNALWRDLKVTAGDKEIADQAHAVLTLRYSMAELDHVLGQIARDWPDHWRKAPQPDSLVKRIKALRVDASNCQLSVLERYYKRWQLAEKTLRNRARSCSLAS